MKFVNLIADRADQDLVRNSRGISEEFGYPPTDPTRVTRKCTEGTKGPFQFRFLWSVKWDEHLSMFGTPLVPESQWNVVNWRLI